MPHSVAKNRKKIAVLEPGSQGTETSPKQRAAIYVRASSEGQVEGKEITTLDAQLATCRNFALARGWEVVLEEEETSSGRTLNKRPKLQSILAAIEQGHIQHLVVKNITRLSRSVSDYSNM